MNYLKYALLLSLAAGSYVLIVLSKPGRVTSKSATSSDVKVMNRKFDLIRKIEKAARSGSPSTESLYRSYLTEGYGWDSFAYLAMSRYYIGVGRNQEARVLLRDVIHPPAGASSTQSFGGEVMSLYLQASKGAHDKDFDEVVSEWTSGAAKFFPGKKVPEGMTSEAVAEYLLGSDCEAKDMQAEAIAHYDIAASLAPHVPIIFLRRGIARRASGDRRSAMLDFNSAVDLSSETERPQMLRAANVDRSQLKAFAKGSSPD